MSGVVKNIIGTTAQAAGSLVRDTPQRLYNVANLAWHYVPEGRGIKSAIQNTWENAPESTAMRAAGVFGATITGAIAAGTAAAIAPPLVALGIGTAGGLLLLNSDPRTSLKVASAAAASAATFVAIPAVAAAASVAAAETGVAAIAYAASLVPTSLVTASAGMAAIGTGAAVLAAENPERSLLVQFPGRSPRELRTVDLEPLVPLATNLTELERLSANFRTQHPPEMPAVLKESSRQVDPQVEWNRQKQQIQTNAAKDRLIANIAAYTSADFIFIKRLGLPRRSADGSNIVMQIAELASRQCDGKYPNLWDTCMGCLKQNGIRLTTIQWIRAKFWYFLSDTIGIVPNTFKEVGKSILKYLRGGVQPKQLPIDIARFIAIADSFLEKYKSAMKQYADAGQLGCPANTGGLADYQRNMVDELGEAGLVEIAKNHRKPGQNLGKVIIQDLCKEFVEAVVNDPEIFPSIPFFQKLQNISFKGIRFGAFFDPFAWVFGGIFNWVGKKIIKAYAPDIVQDIVKKGLYQVMPGNFTFKIAVANSLKAQIETLDIQFRLGIPTQPLRFIKNRKLNDVISKLLEILELTARKGNAASLRHTFRELEERENPTLANNQQLEEARKTNQDLNDALIEGAQFLIEHYTKNPEALEQLFEKLFELSNEAFHSGARVDTEEQYRHASDSLQAATKTLIGKLVEKTIREKAHGEDQDTIDKIFTGMHINEPANPIRRTPAIVINRQGVFNEHKEQAQKTAQLLAGLALKMSKELQADRDAPIAPTPQQPAMKVQDAEALLRTAQAAGQQTQLKQAEFQLEFAKAQTKYDDAKIHFQERRSGVDGANASDLPEAKFHLATATNEYEKAGLECEIAREKCRVAQEAERLEILIASTNDEISHAGNDPAVLAEMRKKLQDAETKLTYVREEEAPGLIEARVKFNDLKRPCDHPLKDLDHYEQVIDRFAKHIKSLNIDLYRTHIQIIFNDTFSPIHQRVVRLAEQLKDLQTLGQRYDKSKKLSALFLNIEDIVINAENSPPQQTLVDAFRTKLENIQEVASLFRKFEENLDENVTPFRVRIEQLEAIAKAYAAKDATLKQLQALGTPDQLGRAILTYPRTSVERLHAIIPEEDEDRISLFGLIAQLQTRAAQTPRPDLRIDHAAIAVKFSKILRRYQDQKQQQFELGISQHLQIKEWVQERLQAITNQRDQSRLELAEKFKILQRDTKQLGRKVEQVELQSPPLFRVARVVPGLPSHLDGLKDKHLRMITNLTDAAYDFITSEEVPEALTRLTLGEVIRTHKK